MKVPKTWIAIAVVINKQGFHFSKSGETENFYDNELYFIFK